MSFQNQSNVSRVNKIDGYLELIAGSAQSNRAKPEEVFGMLEQLNGILGEMGFKLVAKGQEPTPAPAAASTSGATIRDIVDQASIAECFWALQSIVNRIEQEAFDMGKTGDHVGFAVFPKTGGQKQ